MATTHQVQGQLLGKGLEATVPSWNTSRSQDGDTHRFSRSDLSLPLRQKRCASSRKTARRPGQLGQPSQAGRCPRTVIMQSAARRTWYSILLDYRKQIPQAPPAHPTIRGLHTPSWQSTLTVRRYARASRTTRGVSLLHNGRSPVAFSTSFNHAEVAKLADAPDLGSGAVRRRGSSPLFRTKFMGRNPNFLP